MKKPINPDAKPRKRKKAPNPFHRAPRLPSRMQGSADLWLEMFMGFTHALIQETSSSRLPQALTLLDTAKELSDRALEIFETRWPGADL